MAKKEFKQICSRHDDIITTAEEIIDILENKQSTIEEVFKGIKKRAREIVKETYKAKESGQKMEDRLTEYRSTIESIGFTRNGT